MQNDLEERRRYPRSRTGFPTVKDTSGPGVLNHVDNISCNGVLCHTVKPVAEMTKMSIILELPNPVDKRIEAEGIVIRCQSDEQGDDHFKVAILYTKLSDEDYESIQEYVEHDLAQAAPEA